LIAFANSYNISLFALAIFAISIAAFGLVTAKGISVGSIQLSRNANGIDVNPNTNMAYVANFADNTISVLTNMPSGNTIPSSITQNVMAQQAGNILTYQNSTLGIKIQYPSDWIEEGFNWNVFPSRIGLTPSIYGHPQSGPTIYVGVFRNTSLDQLVHMLTPVPLGPKPLYVLDGPVKSVPGSFKGNPANLLIYRYHVLPENQPTGGNMTVGVPIGPKANALPISVMYEILISKDNNSYLIAYSAFTERDYNTFFLAAQQIINSFEITNPPSESIPIDKLGPMCIYTPGNCAGG
jgi:hypothetical protein